MPVTDLSVLSGQEIAYAEITSNFSYNTDNNITDITGLTITFTPLQAKVLVELGGSYVQSGTTGSTPIVYIADSANQFYAFSTETVITGALLFSVGTIQSRFSLTPGTSYTFKGQVKRGNASSATVTLPATAVTPYWIRATYL